MTVKLIWATPEADKLIGYCARVSNPANQDNENVAGLLAYCAKNHHWSVFEMATAVIEINTTRDIGTGFGNGLIPFTNTVLMFTINSFNIKTPTLV